MNDVLNVTPEQAVAIVGGLAIAAVAARRFMQRATRPRSRRRAPPPRARGRGAFAGALETRYKSYRFRSRLEARWATFLDALDGVVWEYEPQGFRLPDGTPYLPDFHLASGWWLEIKGQVPTAAEARRCIGLAVLTNDPVVLAVGLPDNHYLSVYLPARSVPVPARLHTCLRCGLAYVVGRGVALPLSWACTCESPRWGEGVRLVRAFDAARAARFEHGEGRPAA